MKIVFISNYLPCPPNNGVSLPLYHLIAGLKAEHEVYFWHVNDHSRGPLDSNAATLNNEFVDFTSTPIRRLSRLKRLASEIFQGEPYFQGYDPASIDLPKKFRDADVFIYSPFPITGLQKHLAAQVKAAHIAWINDSTTAMMRSRLNYLKMKGIPAAKKVLYLSQWLRSLYMGRLENSVLSASDLVFVQTATEQRWMDKISSGTLNKKVRIVTNGVNEALFKRNIAPGFSSFLFFGDMSGIYNDLVIWLLKNVWPILRKEVEGSTFQLIGKNATQDVIQLVNSDDRIFYQSYVEKIEDVFEERSVMLAPVFKDFGVINKVLEAMAAGVPVVGDKTAFNGIPNFEHGIHGLVADAAEAMAREAIQISNDQDRYRSVAESARQLMKTHFSWESRIHSVNTNLRQLSSLAAD